MEFRAFGCSLDVLDAPEKVAMKLAYLEALERGLLEEGVARDPYDLLLGRLADVDGLTDAGRLELDSYLTPRPAPGDNCRLSAEAFRAFLDSGGCARVAGDLREYVAGSVLPGRPLLLGVDHSLTGGVMEALSAGDGGEELALIILDSHFDAVPATLRMAASVNVAPGGGTRMAELPESYNCGTWIADILDRDIVSPGNVAVLGPSDHPGYEPGDDEGEGMSAYREAYLALEEQGVTVIPKRTIRRVGAREAVATALEGMEGKSIYISLDADLGAGEEVKAVRFLDTIGLTVEEVIGVARALRGWLEETGSPIAGMDVMEIDVHLADIPGSGDRTVEMCAESLRVLLERVADERGDFDG